MVTENWATGHATAAGRTFCYVVLAHTDSAGLSRLLARIRQLSPTAGIVVRHEVPDLVDLTELDRLGVVDLVSDIRVRWGSWAMVEAMIEAFGTALAAGPAEYVTLISGQDYPIRDLREWEGAVRASGADALLSPMTAAARVYCRRHYGFVVPQRSRFTARVTGAVLDRVGRQAPPGVELFRLPRGDNDHWRLSIARRGEHPPWWFFKASQWMTLEADLLATILAAVHHDVAWKRTMRRFLVPDEIALQSVARALARHPVEYATSAMSFPPDAPSPDWLTPVLVRSLAENSPAPFARKMPTEGWEPVVAAADAAVERRSVGSMPRLSCLGEGSGATTPA